MRFTVFMDPDQAASAQARLQHGLITRTQARELGISDDAIDWRVKTGGWERLQRGVLRLPGAPATWQQGIMAPCLAIPGATASHRAAAALWEIPDVPARPEITVAHWHGLRLEGVQVHRADNLDYQDRVWRSRIPVTSLPRTVIDLSATLRPEQVEAVVDHLLAKRRIPLSMLRSRLATLGTQGRRGAGTLAGILAERQGRERHVDSEAQRRLEKLVTEAARRGLLPRPYFEYPVQLSDGTWRYPDVGYPHHLTGVELLSYEHHSTLAAFARDVDRTLKLAGEEWLLIPLTDLHVRKDPHGVVALIARVLARREVRKENRVPHG
jgi:Transcriptional regulator, AbiEi antitoxin